MDLSRDVSMNMSKDVSMDVSNDMSNHVLALLISYICYFTIHDLDKLDSSNENGS